MSLLTMVPHMISEKPLCWISLIAVGALICLYCNDRVIDCKNNN